MFPRSVLFFYSSFFCLLYWRTFLTIKIAKVSNFMQNWTIKVGNKLSHVWCSIFLLQNPGWKGRILDVARVLWIIAFKPPFILFWEVFLEKNKFIMQDYTAVKVGTHAVLILSHHAVSVPGGKYSLPHCNGSFCI